MKGSYLLILHLDTPLADLQVGQLGCFGFPCGYYLYAGSAFGSGGVEARLAYHSRKQKARPHWHIDFLRTHARLLETWSVISPVRLECALVQGVLKTCNCDIPVRGFGSSDCDCVSHLLYKPVRPRSQVLTDALLDSFERAGAQLQELRVEVNTHDE